MDQSARTLTCALWGKDAEEFEANGGVPGCVLAIKSARLSDFNGAMSCTSFFSASASASSSYLI